MMTHTIGTCSKCGGPVTQPMYWGGPVPPVPSCSRCGATAKNPYGPVIEMDAPKRTVSNVETPTPYKCLLTGGDVE